MNKMNGPVRIGIGGPVGAGKTSLTAALARRLSERYSIGVITNDIYTREDAEALMRLQILPEDRVIGVETGGCPHTAIREDASINLSAIAELEARHPEIEIVMIESGGDNLSATFSPELADLTVYVIDVAAGEEIPRKGGPCRDKIGCFGDQQNRSGALCWRRFRGDASRCLRAASGEAVFLCSN